ncbi:hypothetical protein OYE22_22885 [Streptomyces sp. 71268]|uniref:hypothetical protein n=1 Tax=Streptomyces sp. 71268 TaxID=3002640 RepID=UPI0023F7DA27|nr:hypothetical protein [Streptomyces sp. 71268]WEV27707.1 hypothetical protein OYE22_22885 [Streptomyces sp. 71268]
MITKPENRPLPVDAYLLTNREEDAFVRARHTLVTRCMARFGFRYGPLPEPGFRTRNRTQHRYGVSDPQQTATHGFAPPGSPRHQKPRRKRSSLSPAMSLVLSGTDDPKVMPGSVEAKGGQRINGRTVPNGGCFGQAMDALKARDGDGGGDAELARRITGESFDRSRRDPRVKEVFTRWSRCMRDRGFSYADPVAANNDPAWRTPTPSATERRAATADAVCKRQENVIGVWWTVEAAYQQREIDRHRGELADIRATIDERQRLAKAAVASR